MSSHVVTIGVSGGLVLAGLVKVLLTFAWRCVRAPRGRHRHGWRSYNKVDD